MNLTLRNEILMDGARLRLRKLLKDANELQEMLGMPLTPMDEAAPHRMNGNGASGSDLPESLSAAITFLESQPEQKAKLAAITEGRSNSAFLRAMAEYPGKIVKVAHGTYQLADSVPATRHRKPMSAAARKRISVMQKARWAKHKKEHGKA